MTTLFDAIESGDLRALRKLMRTGIGLEQTDEDSGVAPLALAAECGRHDMVEILLRAGADPDWGGATTPIEAAALEGHVAVAGVLVKAAADVNRPVADGFTPLITAASTGNLPMVRLLLEAGANPLVIDDEGESALSHARKNGHKEISELLTAALDNGHGGRTDETLDAALEARSLESLKQALAKEDDLEHVLAATGRDGLTPLARAAQLGHLALVRALLEAGADVLLGGVKTPLLCAVENRHDPLAAALLEAGADVNAADDTGVTPLMTAAASGQLEMVRMLLDEGADPKATDSKRRNCLWYAARAGREQTFAFLLPHVKVAERKTATSELAVHVEGRRRIAVGAALLVDHIHAGEFGRAKQALANGLIDPDGFDEDGRTAMMLAARLGRRDLLRMLIAAGASFELRDDLDGHTALIHAIHSPAKDANLTISLLAVAGADLDRPSVDGRTPLMHAIDRYLDSDSEEIAELEALAKPLLHNGADVEARDHKGSSAWMRIRRRASWEELAPAERRKLSQVGRLLAKNGAQVEGRQRVSLLNAVAQGHAGRVRDLLASYTPKDLVELPLLCVAAANDDWETVNILVSAGIDINTSNSRGETILMQAAAKGVLPIVEHLVQAGADAKLRNKAGESAAELARAASHHEVERLLGA